MGLGRIWGDFLIISGLSRPKSLAAIVIQGPSRHFNERYFNTRFLSAILIQGPSLRSKFP